MNYELQQSRQLNVMEILEIPAYFTLVEHICLFSISFFSRKWDPEYSHDAYNFCHMSLLRFPPLCSFSLPVCFCLYLPHFPLSLPYFHLMQLTTTLSASFSRKGLFALQLSTNAIRIICSFHTIELKCAYLLTSNVGVFSPALIRKHEINVISIHFILYTFLCFAFVFKFHRIKYNDQEHTVISKVNEFKLMHSLQNTKFLF